MPKESFELRNLLNNLIFRYCIVHFDKSKLEEIPKVSDRKLLLYLRPYETRNLTFSGMIDTP